jgi:hypothetical protein
MQLRRYLEKTYTIKHPVELYAESLRTSDVG